MVTTTRIKKISPLQLGKMLAVIYGLISIIIVPFFIIFAVIGSIAGAASHSNGFAPAAFGVGFSVVMALIFPVMYAGFGFIAGVLGGFVYNLVAKWVGGIEVELET